MPETVKVVENVAFKHLFHTMLDWRNVNQFLNFFYEFESVGTSMNSYPYLRPVVVFLPFLSFICVLVFEEFGSSVSFFFL